MSFFGLLSALLLFQSGAPTEITIQLHSEQDNYKGWVLLLNGEDRFDFSPDGMVSFEITSSNSTFEIKNAEGHSKYIDTFANHARKPIIHLYLDKAGIGLEQVVTADRTAQEMWRSPGDISVVNPEDEKERPTNQTSDWLKEKSEVLLQKTNLGGGSPIMRGVSGNRVLLMVDGFRLNNSTFRLGLNQYLNTVPANQIEQFEILNGPSGVQYGSDGLGGTIHLRSQDPSSRPKNTLSYDNFYSFADQTNNHRVDGSIRRGSWSFSAGAGFNDYENLEAADPVGEQEATGYEAWDGSLNATYELDEQRRFRIINHHSEAQHVPRTDRITSGRDLLWEYHPQKLSMHGLRYEETAERAWADSFEVGLAYSLADEGIRQISTRNPNSLSVTRSRVHSVQTNLTMTKYSGKTLWVYGFDGIVDELDAWAEDIDLTNGQSQTIIPKFPDDSGFTSLGGFITAKTPIGKDWSVKGGLRYSWNEITGTLPDVGQVTNRGDKVTPSLNLIYNPQTWFVSLGVSQGFRAPNLEDSMSVGFSSLGFDAPNPNLNPETLWSYEAMMRHRGDHYLLEASVYTSRYEDLIERVPGTYQGSDTYQGEPVSIMDNVGKAEVNGANLRFVWELSNAHRFRGDASWTRGTQTSDNSPMRRIPPLRGNLAWMFHRERYDLTTVFSWADRQDRLSSGDISDSRIPEGGTPGYGVVHLRGLYRFSESLSLAVALENVTDKLYKHHGSGIFEPGRRVVVQLRTNWK